MKKIIIFLLLILLFSSAVMAGSHLPIGLQKIADYNKEQAEFYSQNLSFLVAFLAGVLSVFLPCTLSVLPAFFAYTFKEKKEITKMTFFFFLGFSLIFIIFGVVAAYIGESLISFQLNYSYLVVIAGLLLIMFGIMVILGKGFSSLIKTKKMPKKNSLGTFLMGVFFAVGWSACLGPILAGILLMASVLGSYSKAALLLFAYSFGLFVPIFTMSFLFDKYNIPGFIGKLNKRVGFSITNLIAGLLLIIIGLVFVIYRGTSVINTSTIFGGINVFGYSLQHSLLSFKYVNLIGIIILGVVLFFLWKFLMKRGNKK